MRHVLKLITLIFAICALLQLDDPDGLYWFSIYALGALVSVVTLRDGLPRSLHRLFAVATMFLMFFYFFGFFEMAPELHGNWVSQESGGEALGLLFGAFAMIPVLATYSCRLKAHAASKDRRSPAVFSAPQI